MRPTQIMTNLLKGITSLSSTSITLRPGQIVKGEILKIFPDQTAMISLEGKTLQAKLETSVSVGQRAWFHVLNSVNPIKLKVISSQQLNQESNPVLTENELNHLLKYFNLEAKGEDSKLLQYFIKHNCPVKAEQMKMASHIISTLGVGDDILKSLKVAIERGWTLSADIIKSISSFLFGAPLDQKLNQVITHLPQEHRLMLSAMYLTPTAPVFKDAFKQVILEQGVLHEKGIANSLSLGKEGVDLLSSQTNNVKQILLQLINDPTISLKGKEAVEQMVNHITGQQLFLVAEESQFTSPSQFLFQWALDLNNDPHTVYGKISSRMKNNKIDPDNCRILLFLNLKDLGELAIDIKIVQRLMSIYLYNDRHDLGKLNNYISEFKPAIKEALNNMGYQLSILQFKEVSKSSPLAMFDSQTTSDNDFSKGVDIRL